MSEIKILPRIFISLRRAWGYHNELEVAIFEQTGIKEYSIATNIEMVNTDPGVITKPVAFIKGDDAQSLMDDLWKCGLRSTEGKVGIGQVEAVQGHLSDMRRIVEKKLDVKL